MITENVTIEIIEAASLSDVCVALLTIENLARRIIDTDGTSKSHDLAWAIQELASSFSLKLEGLISLIPPPSSSEEQPKTKEATAPA